MSEGLAGERVLCCIYLRSTDLVHTQAAPEWIVAQARKHGLAGATVLEGIYGFGSRGVVAPSLWHVSVPRPVIVELVDEGDKVMRFVADCIMPALRHGTVTLERAAVLMYRHRASTETKEPLRLRERIADLSTLPALSPVERVGRLSMLTTGDGILLRIFAGEADVVEGRPLYEAVVAKARELGLAGATVMRGAMGFGANSVVHTTKLLELSTDLPIVMELVDTEEKIRALLPAVEEMVKEGLITMESVRIVAYRHAPADG